MRAHLVDGGMAQVGGESEHDSVLDERATDDIVACLAPAEAVGVRLCAIETVNGPHRLLTEYFEHAAVARLRTSGRLESVTIDWREAGCPFMGLAPPN